MKAILKNLDACEEALLWVGDRAIEEAVNECPRGDWMLWLAQRLGVDFKALTLAKGHCANTVRHLMIDERSIKAVDTAIAFGKGEATIEDLMEAAASDASASTSYASYTTYAYDPAAAYASAAATYATYASVNYAAAAAAFAADSVYVDEDSVYVDEDSVYVDEDSVYVNPAAKKENQLLTANICREHLGQLIIDKCKSFNK